MLLFFFYYVICVLLNNKKYCRVELLITFADKLSCISEDSTRWNCSVHSCSKREHHKQKTFFLVANITCCRNDIHL